MKQFFNAESYKFCMVIIAVIFSFKNKIFGFDYLGFQSIKRFPTNNTIFLPVMQSTITKNSFILVFYSYVLVFYPYVTGMYLVCTRMLLVCTRMYPYVTRMYLYVTRMYSCGVLVTIYIFSQVSYENTNAENR